MASRRMLAELLEQIEIQLYDEPISREMLVSVIQRLTFVVDQLGALIRDSQRELQRRQASQLAVSRITAIKEGLSWLEAHGGAAEDVLFAQLHVVFQEAQGTLILLGGTVP